MTEWGVFLVLSALAAFMALIIKPIITLTKSIAKLTTIVDRLEVDITEQRSQAVSSHKRLWKHNEEQDEKIALLEQKLAIIEAVSEVQ